MFPAIRPRRLRRSAAMRALVRETRLSPEAFVYPLFVRHGRGVRDEIAGMPGNFHFSPDTLLEEVGAAREDGVRAVLLFGLPEKKDSQGSEAWSDDGAVQTALRQIKAAHDDVLVMTDVCLCGYTDHGHCGPLAPDGSVDNDAALVRLGEIAVSQARAGADIVAPSGMDIEYVSFSRSRRSHNARFTGMFAAELRVKNAVIPLSRRAVNTSG